MPDLTGGERGFLLLTSCLGDPARKPLTVAQFRELTHRSHAIDFEEKSRDLEISDLVGAGYTREEARYIVSLLEDEALLEHYLKKAERLGCIPITRASAAYPVILRRRLGLDAPGVLWARGDDSLLERPAVSLVGSRDLKDRNRAFAREVGIQAAKQGLTLISGNARGADKTAQNACLSAGGSVISIVADSLLQHTPGDGLLYLSEDGYDEGFSAQRALSRNRCIHAMGRMVIVAQASMEKGGTWNGTVKNLRNGWSNVVCFQDGSEAVRQLEQMGAFGIGTEDLQDFSVLANTEQTFFDR